MHASMPLEDMTHENLWRQLLRWVVDGVPDSVDVHTSSERVEAGEPVTLTAEVVDKSFVELNDARVVAKVKDPQGNTVDVPMQWTGERSGEYRAHVHRRERGHVYGGRRSVARGQAARHRARCTCARHRATPSTSTRRMHAARLKRIADETGGRFYTPDTVNALPEDLKYAGRGVTTVEERDLWHMPIVLLADRRADGRRVGAIAEPSGWRRTVGSRQSSIDSRSRRSESAVGSDVGVGSRQPKSPRLDRRTSASRSRGS